MPEGATLKDVPQMIDKETCENLFLDQIVDFDEAKFDEMAVDGQIRREVLEEVSLGAIPRHATTTSPTSANPSYLSCISTPTPDPRNT